VVSSASVRLEKRLRACRPHRNPLLSALHRTPHESARPEYNTACPVVNRCRTSCSLRNTARFCVLALLASENRGLGLKAVQDPSGHVFSTAGPCLKPWPEPPPTNQTFSIPGCRSIRKSPLEVFSYWQTRVSTIGASFKAGNRRSTYVRALSSSPV